MFMSKLCFRTLYALKHCEAGGEGTKWLGNPNQMSRGQTLPANVHKFQITAVQALLGLQRL